MSTRKDMSQVDKKKENIVEYKKGHVSRWIRRKRTWLSTREDMSQGG